MKSLLPPAILGPIAHSHRLLDRLQRHFRANSVSLGIVTDQRPDGSWNWQNGTVWPEDDVADFPPEVGAHYRVLIPGDKFPQKPDAFTTEPALVIGEQTDHGQRIFLLRLQTSIEPNPLHPEATVA